MSYNKKIIKLGKICIHDHEYKNTGKSLRYIKSNHCVKCDQEYQQTRRSFSTKVNIKKKRDEQKARKLAAEHCPKYSECLNTAAHKKWGRAKMPCHKCEEYQKIKVEGVWKKEA